MISGERQKFTIELRNYCHPFPAKHHIERTRERKKKAGETHLTTSGRRSPTAAFSEDFKFDKTTVSASRISVEVSTGHEGFRTSVSGFWIRI